MSEQLPPWPFDGGATFVDARQWVGHTATASDRGPQLNKALAAVASERGAVLVLPPWTLNISQPAIVDSFTALVGNPGASRLKVGAGSNCAAVRSARYGLGGASGGTERAALIGLDCDGNFAENPGTTEACVALDGIRPVVDLLTVRNGVVNVSSQMSRTHDPSGDTMEDGILTRLVLMDPQKQNLLFEGPHDSLVDVVNCRSNVEGFANIAMKGVSPHLSRAHPYGNARYAVELEGGYMSHCVLEGGRLGQLLLPTTGHEVWSSLLFNGGGADGKIGVVVGETAASQAYNNHLYDIRMEGLVNGLFRYNTAENSGLYASGYSTAATGEAIVGEKSPNVDNDFRDLHVEGGMIDNSKAATVASAGAFFVGRKGWLEVTGVTEINTLQGGAVGQTLTLYFVGTPKVAVTGNIRLAGSIAFAATEKDTLTLKLKGDGNWYEIGRAVI